MQAQNWGKRRGGDTGMTRGVPEAGRPHGIGTDIRARKEL